MEIQRIFDLLPYCAQQYGSKKDFFACKENNRWITYSVQDYIHYANLVSYGLLAMGLKKGDVIATISNNRPEWNFIDMGMMQAGVIHLPIYPTISRDEYRYIFLHAMPKIIIVSDRALFEKISSLTEDVPSIQKIYTFNKVEGVPHWSEITEEGKNHAAALQEELEKVKSSIVTHDIATLIYTSGTTGFPKGVMLSHQNLISNFTTTAKVHGYGSESRALSFLPLCHIYERMINYHYQYKGICIYYAENLGAIADNLKEVKPTLFATVPRIIELFYEKIISRGKELPLPQRLIFFWAVRLAMRYKQDYNAWYGFWRKIADRLVFRKWREALGGNLKIIISGGASLQERFGKIFGAADIIIAEGYGLTETSPVIAVSNIIRKEIRYGTVGPVLEGVQVKFGEDGEILCKGPNVMPGYYKDPALTREAIDEEGFFHTGDIGTLIEGKYLKITDRKKEIFKLSSGKYIAPQVIENKLKESLFIEQAMVTGENQKFASALICPNFPYLHHWASHHHIDFQDNKDLIANPKIIALFQKEINAINEELGQTEQIKRFRLVADEWSSATGELSPTLKLKRKTLQEKYQLLIAEIYNL